MFSRQGRNPKLTVALAARHFSSECRHGPVHQRHPDDGRSVPACGAGHLLCRKADPQSPARHDRQGDQPRPRGGLQGDISRRPRSMCSGSSRLSSCSANSPRARNARRSTASSRRQTRSPPRSRTRRVLDAALIIAAQAVEHYEITRYGSLIAWPGNSARTPVARLSRHHAARGKGGRQEADGIAEKKVNLKATA